MDADFAGLCENVNNFSKDEIFASDTPLITIIFISHQGQLLELNS